MGKLKVISVSDVKTEKERIDGKESRQYVSVIFGNASNPFDTRGLNRNFFQRHKADGTATWSGTSPQAMKAMEGKEIEGEFITKKVEPFQIGEGENARTVDTYTAAVLIGEKVEEVFRQSGHKIVGEAETNSAEIPAIQA